MYTFYELLFACTLSQLLFFALYKGTLRAISCYYYCTETFAKYRRIFNKIDSVATKTEHFIANHWAQMYNINGTLQDIKSTGAVNQILTYVIYFLNLFNTYKLNDVSRKVSANNIKTIFATRSMNEFPENNPFPGNNQCLHNPKVYPWATPNSSGGILKRLFKGIAGKIFNKDTLITYGVPLVRNAYKVYADRGKIDLGVIKEYMEEFNDSDTPNPEQSEKPNPMPADNEHMLQDNLESKPDERWNDIPSIKKILTQRYSRNANNLIQVPDDNKGSDVNKEPDNDKMFEKKCDTERVKITDLDPKCDDEIKKAGKWEPFKGPEKSDQITNNMDHDDKIETDSDSESSNYSDLITNLRERDGKP